VRKKYALTRLASPWCRIQNQSIEAPMLRTTMRKARL